MRRERTLLLDRKMKWPKNSSLQESLGLGFILCEPRVSYFRHLETRETVRITL